MRIAGADQAIGNLVKWSTRDDWAPYREEVFASHMDPIALQFDIDVEDLAEMFGESVGMLYGVILEDFFAARFGEDGELNIVDDYLKRRGWRDKVPAKRYLAAIRDSVMSLYEVVDLDPGKAMTVRDLIRGGDAVTVEEKMGSQSAARWDRIAARLVTVNGKPCFTGGMLLMPHDAASGFLAAFEKMTTDFRARLRREAKKQGEDPEIAREEVKELLLSTMGPQLFTKAWLIDALEKINAPLPDVRNTDGDQILFSEVRFPIAGGEDAVVGVIDGLENIARDSPDGASWTWHGPGSPSQRMAEQREAGATQESLTFQSVDDHGRTTLGDIKIRDGVLLLGTNSRERAERGRDLLASHLGTLVGPPLISHESLERMMDESAGAGIADDDQIPPELAAQVLGDCFDDHYRRTLDHPLPHLDGKTPRQAVKTKKGRARVVEWLKYLENSEHRRAIGQGREPYDMTWMWRELKLDAER